jgi:hypothetical protein
MIGSANVEGRKWSTYITECRKAGWILYDVLLFWKWWWSVEEVGKRSLLVEDKIAWRVS